MKKSNYLSIFIVIFFITLLLVNPVKYSNSIFNGINLFFYNILPTLFPFMFFSRLLTSLNFATICSKYICKPVNFIYHTSTYSAYIFVMSLICGYPLSSKILADLYNNNLITIEEILPISSFTSNSNPLFIIGTIGGIMLKNKYFALIILISHYTSSIINGIINSTIILKKQPLQFNPIINYNKVDLLDTMLNSVMNILIVCGYIVIFNYICDCLIDYNIISFIAKPIEIIYSKIKLPTILPYYNILSMVEVTRGIKELTYLPISPTILLPTICSCLSFGGLCINIQCFSFLQSTGIKFSKFIYIKITQAILAYVICYLLCLALKI